MWAMDRGFIQAHAESQQHAERDWHIHIGATVTQCLPGRAKEYPAGINQRRQRDQRRDTVEQIARRRLGARPHRDRQQHDIAGCKARHRERTDQFRQRRIRSIAIDLEQMRFIAHIAQRFDERRRCGIGAPFDGDALRGEINPCPCHAIERTERLFDRANTGAAMNVRHREIGLPQTAGNGTADQQDFARIRRRQYGQFCS
jgi:hypothetical protein